MKLGVAPAQVITALAILTHQRQTAEAVVQADAIRGVAGRSKLSHLLARDEWRRVTRQGIQCPEPLPCECHCNCPAPTRISVPPIPPCPPRAVTPPKSMMSPPPTPAPSAPPAEKYSPEVDALRQRFLATPPNSPEHFYLRQQLLNAHAGVPQVVTTTAAAPASNVGVVGHVTGSISDATSSVSDAIFGMEVKPPAFLESSGPEFFAAEETGTVHCEPWTGNGNKHASLELCAVVCRTESSCFGFNVDATHGWCLWYSAPGANDFTNNRMWIGGNVEQASAHQSAPCSMQLQTAYMKTGPSIQNASTWYALQTVHALQSKFEDALSKEPADGNEMIAALHAANENAIRLATAEAAICPPLAAERCVPPTTTLLGQRKLAFTTTTVPLPTTSSSTTTPESVAVWADLHPDCPKGVPCFCDCQCRGALPENFAAQPPLQPPCV